MLIQTKQTQLSGRNIEEEGGLCGKKFTKQWPSAKLLTHRVKIIKDLVNSDNFVVKFIVRRGRRKKRISVGDEKVENVYNLHKTGEKQRMVRQEM